MVVRACQPSAGGSDSAEGAQTTSLLIVVTCASQRLTATRGGRPLVTRLHSDRLSVSRQITRLHRIPFVMCFNNRPNCLASLSGAAALLRMAQDLISSGALRAPIPNEAQCRSLVRTVTPSGTNRSPRLYTAGKWWCLWVTAPSTRSLACNTADCRTPRRARTLCFSTSPAGSG